MKQSTHILNDLVSTMRDGKTFYEFAATKVDKPELRELFLRLARVKGEMILGLSNEVRARGEIPAESGTWSGDFSRFYGEIRALLGDKNYAYVARLEESEDQLLRAFELALNNQDLTTGARTVIVQFLPEVHTCHDIMRAQKIALKKAA